MNTFLVVLAAILGVCAAIGLGLLAFYFADEHLYRWAACSATAAALLTALLITWAVKAYDSESGRCGDGTTRVGYHHGKTTTYVCERTPQ